MNKKILSLVSATLAALPVLASAVATQQAPTGKTWSTVTDGITKLMYSAGIVVVIVGGLIAGILFATSNGDPEKVGKARQTLIWTVGGGVVLMIAASIMTILTTDFSF